MRIFFGVGSGNIRMPSRHRYSLEDCLALEREIWQPGADSAGLMRNQRYQQPGPHNLVGHSEGSAYKPMYSPYQGSSTGRAVGSIAEHAWRAKAKEHRAQSLRSIPHANQEDLQWSRASNPPQRLSAQDLRDFLSKTRVSSVAPLATDLLESYARPPHKTLTIADGVHLRSRPAESPGKGISSTPLLSLDSQMQLNYSPDLNHGMPSRSPYHGRQEYSQTENPSSTIRSQAFKPIPGHAATTTPTRPRSVYDDSQRTLRHIPKKSNSVQGAEDWEDWQKRRPIGGGTAASHDQSLQWLVGVEDAKSLQHGWQKPEDFTSVLRQSPTSGPADGGHTTDRSNRLSAQSQPVMYEQNFPDLPASTLSSPRLQQEPNSPLEARYDSLHLLPLMPLQPQPELSPRTRKKHRAGSFSSGHPPSQAADLPAESLQKAAGDQGSIRSRHSTPLGYKHTYANSIGSGKANALAETETHEVVYEMQPEEDLSEIKATTAMKELSINSKPAERRHIRVKALQRQVKCAHAIPILHHGSFFQSLNLVYRTAKAVYQSGK